MLLAQSGEVARAREVAEKALGVYAAVGAAWDVVRCESRIRAWGIRRGKRGVRAGRAASGWGALTPMELRVAALVAALVVAACGGAADEPIGPTFGATLRSSSEVVRPITTTGSGTASLSVRGNVVSYGISALNLSGGGTGALHLGAAGAEGPAVVRQLFVQDPIRPTFISSG